MECAKCQGEVEGYKCAVCGFESDEEDSDHLHDGRCHHFPKCAGCSECEVHCKC